MWRACVKRGRALLPALLLLFAGGSATAQSASPDMLSGPAILEVVSAGDEVLADFRVSPGDRWCMAWNHSVTGIRVLDCYRYHMGRMMLERSHQPDFAAGLGHIPGRGVQTSDGAGGYWIEDIREFVPGNGYLLRVGSSAVNHRILMGETRTGLSALAAGQRVLIRLRARGQNS